jgi:NAD(P)-dependent dehydrogenase (short-subunit alcohol dehydrogenase family)
MDRPNFDMTGKVALLTGAGRGIGLAIAQAFASAGAAVALQDIDEAVAIESANKINAAGGRAIGIGGDAGDLSLPVKCVESVVQELGGLHVLVNNAAIQRQVSWMEQPADEMVHTLTSNLVSPILFCREAATIFKAQKYGRIINVTSIQALRGNAGMLPYSLSKSALVTLTRALARDLASHGITVNAIGPGWFNTLRNKKDFESAEDVKERGKNLPLGRVGEPKDCAGAALLLASAAGEYITGQTIYVDGGMTA